MNLFVTTLQFNSNFFVVKIRLYFYESIFICLEDFSSLSEAMASEHGYWGRRSVFITSLSSCLCTTYLLRLITYVQNSILLVFVTEVVQTRLIKITGKLYRTYSYSYDWFRTLLSLKNTCKKNAEDDWAHIKLSNIS